jgi:hypothetical protein
MSFSANVPIPYLGKGQLVAEWSKDFLAATTMLKMDDVQRIQLLPMYVSRTPGEKALAESVSELTEYKAAIDEIKKLIDGETSTIQLTKSFFDVQAPQDGDCTSVYFELYSKGTAADVPSDMIFKRFLTFFKIGDQFYVDHAAEIKVQMTKAESLAVFGKFKSKLDKLKKPVAIKVETEEMYHAITQEREEKPSWAKDLQNQINDMRDEMKDSRSYAEASDDNNESESEENEAFYYNNVSNNPQDQKGAKRQVKKCKICQKEGHYAETCRRRVCLKCKGKGHSDFECPSFTYKKNTQKTFKKTFQRDRQA